MTKQVLDVQQMQHLQELGLDTSNASMYWISYNGINVSIPSNFHLPTSDNDYVICDAYTLQDVLDALPKNVSSNGKAYYLNVDLCVGYVCYDRRMEDNLLVGASFAKTGCLIDAAYSMLCWAIDNKFVETNKNE